MFKFVVEDVSNASYTLLHSIEPEIVGAKRFTGEYLFLPSSGECWITRSRSERLASGRYPGEEERIVISSSIAAAAEQQASYLIEKPAGTSGSWEKEAASILRTRTEQVGSN